MVKEKLISLVALVDVKTEDIIFINDDPSVEKLADNVKDNYKKNKLTITSKKFPKVLIFC